MAVRVSNNNLPNRAEGAAVQEAVLGAIGAPEGDWRVQIHENPDSPSWHITILGPNEFRWTREFFGPDEQNQADGYAALRRAVADALAGSLIKIRPIVCLSYAYPDNKDLFVNQFADRLGQELQVQFGEPINVIWDTHRLHPDAKWSEGAEKWLQNASFLVPILSPSYFKSDLCRKEFEVFLDREQRTGRTLIFPVRFVATGAHEDSAAQEWPTWVQGLRRHKFVDLRLYRFNLDSKEALRVVSFLAGSIRDSNARNLSEAADPRIDRQSVIKAAEPLYVKTLRLRNFRCFEQLELRFDRPSSLEGRWTCIAGINGAGKSSILQALGIALLGYPMALELGGARLNRMRRLVDLFNRMRAEVEVVLSVPHPDPPVQLRVDIDDGQIVAKGDAAFGPPVWDRVRRLLIAGYGATRNLSSRTDFVSENLSPDVRRQITLFEPLSQLAGADVLLGRQYSTLNLEELLQNAIGQVFGDELKVTPSGSPPSGISFTVSGQDTVDAMDLPDGYRSLVAWLADLCAFWCEKAPDLAANANPADIHAIVLIDEIDLHLHPSLQRALIPRLRKSFPNVQWIVTTHSPLVLANFDANEIIALDRDTYGKIRDLDRQILSFTADEIYEWLMGTQPGGVEIEEELRKSDEGIGKGQEEIASMMRVSPDTDEEAARKHVTEFKEILKTLKR
ncbi:MAG TPA: AAA family ATPase [Bryobacteraceae bacterium]|nr:AAA family ATPase [Bryobacteraceae bacterium]